MNSRQLLTKHIQLKTRLSEASIDSRERKPIRGGRAVSRIQTTASVFVDIETGGLEFTRPIVQIAAIAVDAQLNVLDEFEAKIQFDERVACPNSLRRIHYDRAEWKRAAIAPRKATWSFARFLRRHASVKLHRRDLSVFGVAQLVSHNSQFDGPFLRAWYERQRVFFPASYRFHCTLQRAYWFFQENPQLTPPDNYRLLSLCRYFDVPLHADQAHEAVADVRATVGICRAMRRYEREVEESRVLRRAEG